MSQIGQIYDKVAEYPTSILNYLLKLDDCKGQCGGEPSPPTTGPDPWAIPSRTPRQTFAAGDKNSSGAAKPLGNHDTSGGQSAKAPIAEVRNKGDKMKESSTLDDALQQAQGIEKAQAGARQAGAGDATIQATKKTEQNLQKRLDDFKKKDPEPPKPTTDPKPKDPKGTKE
jgi:hypothetical protein